MQYQGQGPSGSTRGTDRTYSEIQNSGDAMRRRLHKLMERLPFRAMENPPPKTMPHRQSTRSPLYKSMQSPLRKLTKCLPRELTARRGDGEPAAQANGVPAVQVDGEPVPEGEGAAAKVEEDEDEDQPEDARHGGNLGSALHAAAAGHLEVVEFLLKLGANPREWDLQHRTPEQVAHFKIAELLSQFGRF
ncbi:hypothetical protein EDB83DRAFT_2320115 [Lactarius deliciosus]|nr:hypothetical protein EDB83DRAFT_2320115 [Lactarius deliciosus]